jgi:hypothetical protein
MQDQLVSWRSQERKFATGLTFSGGSCGIYGVMQNDLILPL